MANSKKSESELEPRRVEWEVRDSGEAAQRIMAQQERKFLNFMRMAGYMWKPKED